MMLYLLLAVMTVLCVCLFVTATRLTLNNGETPEPLRSVIRRLYAGKV
jgi:hypothetical protein